jgi:hypothetical protein
VHSRLNSTINSTINLFITGQQHGPQRCPRSVSCDIGTIHFNNNNNPSIHPSPRPSDRSFGTPQRRSVVLCRRVHELLHLPHDLGEGGALHRLLRPTSADEPSDAAAIARPPQLRVDGPGVPRSSADRNAPLAQPTTATRAWHSMAWHCAAHLVLWALATRDLERDGPRVGAARPREGARHQLRRTER